MLRYILVLLLVSASYRSLGNPINPTGPVTLVNSLTALAGDCGNTFLVNQIKANIISCSNFPSPNGEKQLQCLVFYDINKQLCASVVGAGKTALPEEDYTAKINEEQDVNSLCVSAKDWVFSNLTEFPRYKQSVDKVFKHPSLCGKVCATEDFMSDDANYFCKYFKWGTDVLKEAIPDSTQNVIKKAQLSEEVENVNKDETALASNDLQDVQIKETSSTNAKLNTPSSNSPVVETQPKVDVIKPETSSLAVNEKSQSVDPGTASNVVAVPDIQANVAPNVDNAEDNEAMPENTLEDNPSKSTQDVAKVDTAQGSETKTKAEDAQNKPEAAQKTEENKALEQLNNELDNKPPLLKTPNGKVPSGDVDDYPDSEEGKEVLMDMQGGDDGDDPLIGDLPPEDPKPAQKAETVAVASTFNRPKEPFYEFPVPDAYPENDDHFFSFFLTAIVLIVLLYVLYHNKNKVGKVFFGLVLEGRAAGRRRGSRGPAYRRLDTLEQAMSAGAAGAAPPSKIIY